MLFFLKWGLVLVFVLVVVELFMELDIQAASGFMEINMYNPLENIFLIKDMAFLKILFGLKKN